MERPKTKEILFALTALALGFAVVLGLAEGALRATGREPLKTPEGKPGVPSVHALDPLLGWRNKPGDYEFPFPQVDGVKRTLTIWPGHLRATAPEMVDSDQKVLLLGCSITQGWGLPDSETYAWRLQERFPDSQFLNYGTGAYGTYQCLLVLEKYLGETETAPALALYGFIEHHQNRNVADAAWLEVISAGHPRDGVGIPYCTLDENGALLRREPMVYPAFPMARLLVGARALQKRYVRLTARRRSSQQEEVTEKLLLEMRDRCREKNVPFVVAILSVSTESGLNHFRNFLTNNNIPVVDGTMPVTPEQTVPEDGHPNGEIHAIWADRIAPAIAPYLTRSEISSAPQE
ncbi:hypothetical protein HQ520_03610 [bacterium]|nr:hypothetical protein [bacterium]